MITKEAAKKAIANIYVTDMMTNGHYDFLKMLTAMLKAIDNIPDGVAWVPMSERRPEKDDVYLVTIPSEESYSYVDGRYVEARTTDTDMWLSNGGEWDCYEGKVIAWAELPDIYMGGEWKDADENRVWLKLEEERDGENQGNHQASR